jgi:hypothetical protein
MAYCDGSGRAVCKTDRRQLHTTPGTPTATAQKCSTVPTQARVCSPRGSARVRTSQLETSCQRPVERSRSWSGSLSPALAASPAGSTTETTGRSPAAKASGDPSTARSCRSTPPRNVTGNGPLLLAANPAPPRLSVAAADGSNSGAAPTATGPVYDA